MPKGPKGQKRPAGVIGNPLNVMRIATGEGGEQEDLGADDGKDKAARSPGQRGGRAAHESASFQEACRDCAQGRREAAGQNSSPKALGLHI